MKKDGIPLGEMVKMAVNTPKVRHSKKKKTICPNPKWDGVVGIRIDPLMKRCEYWYGEYKDGQEEWVTELRTA